MVMNCEQETFIKFENERIELNQLPNRFQPLRKDWRNFFRIDLNMSTSITEFMTKFQPLFTNERLEPIKGTIVRI